VTQAVQLRDGWRRLWRHSYRLGVRWLVRDLRSGWRAGRTGWVRLLVPLDPWRYYELGRLADQPFSGYCLDVSSPKLFTSLMEREGRGKWVGTDLFSREIAGWRRVDPDLTLEIQDATKLGYADDTFDSVVCISVLEHIGAGQDARALSEMWRVLKPGGTLHLTTDVAQTPKDVHVAHRVYGEASTGQGDRVFFKRDYSTGELDELLTHDAWTELLREYAVQVDAAIEQRFYDRAPWSYVYGPLLRWRCPSNFMVSDDPAVLSGHDHGVVYLQLAKEPAGRAR
jgi:ubiquinone/menaquinone biosynthesis C-methylase UbiE